MDNIIVETFAINKAQEIFAWASDFFNVHNVEVTICFSKGRSSVKGLISCYKMNLHLDDYCKEESSYSFEEYEFFAEDNSIGTVIRFLAELYHCYDLSRDGSCYRYYESYPIPDRRECGSII